MIAGQAWADAVQRLWPGAEVRLVRRPGPAGARRELAFLPGTDRPRLLVPTGLPRVAATALRRYSQDLDPPRRLARVVGAATMRSGLPERALRERLHVTGGGESIEDHLSELLGRPVVVTIALGTARANRKPILHVITPRGEPVAFVKVGDTGTARGLIADEAAALTHLATGPLREVTIPRVLHHGEWQEIGLLVLSPLTTTALGWRPRRRVPLAAMRELSRTGDTGSAPLAQSAFWDQVEKAPAELADPARAERLTEVIGRTGDAWGGEVLEFGAWHGDWTPWNMAWHADGPRLWDFERYARCVPYGFDLLHYRLQTELHTTGRLPYESLHESAPALLRPLGVAGPAAVGTMNLYLLELCRRYQLAAQGPLGEPLRAQADRLLDLLRQRAGQAR